MKRTAFLATLLAFLLPSRKASATTDAQKITALLALKSGLNPNGSVTSIESCNYETPGGGEQLNTGNPDWSNVKYYISQIEEILNS